AGAAVRVGLRPVGNARADEPWLPDLCRLPRLAAMLGIAQLVVVVVVLVPDAGSRWDVARVLSTSGFALWLALSVSVLLCVSRRALSRLPRRTGALVAVALAAVVAGVVAAVVHALFASVGEAGAWPSAMRFVTGSAGVVTLITALALRYFYVIDRWQAQGITLVADDDMLRIIVRNPSLPPDAPGVHGAGHAQRSIVHRLGYAFGPRARMTCGW